MTMSIICSRCGVVKDLSNYQKGKRQCKDCHKILAKKRFEDRKIAQKELEIQQCSTCSITKNIDEFAPGYLQCKDCKENTRKKLYEERNTRELETQECSLCHVTKKIDEFRSGYLRCKQCQTKTHNKLINTSVNAYLNQICRNANQSAMRRLNNGRIDAGMHEIDVEYLIRLLDHQEGKCHYSGVKLTLKRYSDWQCSLERFNTDNGYVDGNVGLIVAEFQGRSQWSMDKYNEFIRLINITHEPVDIDWNYVVTRKTPEKIEQSIIDEVIHYKCNHCNIFKTTDQFYERVGAGCKHCVSKYSKDYRNNPHGHVTQLLRNMKVHSKTRNHNPPQFSVDDMKKIIDSQNGLCAYSGIPMTYGSYLDKNWTCSPERCNVNIGYTKENTCFICYEFNTSDSTVKSATEVEGCSGWSKEKIEFIKHHERIRSLDNILVSMKNLFEN